MLGYDDYRNLKRLRETNGAGAAARFVGQLLESKQARPEDFRLGLLFSATHPHAAELAEEYRSGGFSTRTARMLGEERRLAEAGEVTSGDFANITGQIVYSKMLGSFEHEEFVFTKEVEMMPSSFLDLEKIAGIGRIGDDVEIVAEGGLFPNTGPVQDFIHAPPAVKRGQKCALTWEAVFSDRTGQLLTEAGNVGYGLGANKEKRIIDAIIDENTGAKSATAGGHRYHWQNTSYATFQTTSPWDNVTASNTLLDWTDIEAAELTFAAINDPHTGEPINIMPDVLICTWQLRYTARYILSATTVRVAVGGFPATGNVSQTYAPNFLPSYRIVSSKLLDRRMATDTTWFLANLKRAVAYKEARPFKVEPAPTGHPDEFDREIVNQWKASELGNAFVQEPRAIVESTVA